MDKSITSFKGNYRFLSNFYPCPVEYAGIVFPSVEHAYQAAKTTTKNDLMKFVRTGLTAGQAKRLGRQLPLRSDWEEIKISQMHTLVYKKFLLNETLQNKLLSTGDAELVEGNEWGDTFWGVCRGRGENHLGKILMDVRYRISCTKYQL